MYANSEAFQVLAITTMVSSFVAEWYGEVRSGIAVAICIQACCRAMKNNIPGENLNENKKYNREKYKGLPCGFIRRSFNPSLYVEAVLERQKSLLGDFR